VSQTIIEDCGPVRLIRMNRPEKKNALTQSMYGAMADALNDAQAQRAIRACVLLGTNGVFTAGNDLADFAGGGPAHGEAPVTRFLTAIAVHEKPLLAAVEGHAVGVGVTMLLHCDFVVASETAKMQTPFVNLGLVPEAGSSLILPQIAGHQRAAEILMWGEAFGAEQGRDAGFVNRVTKAGEAEAVALDYAARIAAKPPEAIRLTKKLLRSPPESVTARQAAEAHLFAAQLGTAEAKEAFAAFLEKRAPIFS
jgi:enoyl-CoA hydratase/carnithine racemase